MALFKHDPENMASGVLARFEIAAHGGTPPDTAAYRCGEAGSLADGIWVRFWLRLTAESVVDVRYEVYGTPYAIALAEWFAEQAAGASLETCAALAGLEAAEALAIPAERRGEVVGVEDAWQRALHSPN